MPVTTFTRRAAMAALTLLAVGACGNANGDAGPGQTASNGALQEMSLGDPDAPVTLIEYASPTCPACKQFHETVVPTLKADYVETGKVHYVFREFPTAPANVAIAGFAIARCAGTERYFDVLDDLFANQQGILAAARQGAVRPALQAVAERHGIVGEAAFDACLEDRDIRRAIADIVMTGEEVGVTGTPTLILQGRKLEPTVQSRTPEGLSRLIDAELMALDIEPPTRAGEPAETTDGETAAEETTDEAAGEQ